MQPGDPIARFLRHVTDQPDHPAVELGEHVVTYGQLAAKARCLAALFAEVSGAKVLIALPPGPDAYAAMIGTLLGGGYYIPVNIEAPEKKLARVAGLVQPDFIVAGSAYAAKLAPACSGARLIDPARLDADRMLLGAGQRHTNAYVIFTSGSTGVPKGVVISSAALAHYIDWLASADMMRADDRVSQFPNIGFDLSVLDIYGALSAGATLVTPICRGDRLFPAEFAAIARLSVWVSVPSMFGLAMLGQRATAKNLAGVRLFVYCGEPLLRAHLAAMFAAQPDCKVLNLYGPTEATVSMTAVALDAGNYDRACAGSTAIGDAIPGMALHLIDGPHEDEGEIVITGPQLATAYWRDPERTAAAFGAFRIGGRTQRGYRTGDWAERRNGQVFFKYRIDHQIKIHGYRIETGEVIARLADCGYPVSCVLKHGEGLTAVVEVAEGAAFDAGALRLRLFDELDAYAVPALIRGITRMPMNGNDKTDEAAVRSWLDGHAEPLQRLEQSKAAF